MRAKGEKPLLGQLTKPTKAPSVSFVSTEGRRFPEMQPSRGRKVDANQSEVVEYLRRCGWFVCSTAALGNGFPDLLVSIRGFAALVEIKDGSKPPSARKLSRDEVKFRQLYTGPYVLATGPLDACAQLRKLWRKWYYHEPDEPRGVG